MTLASGQSFLGRLVERSLGAARPEAILSRRRPGLFEPRAIAPAAIPESSTTIEFSRTPFLSSMARISPNCRSAAITALAALATIGLVMAVAAEPIVLFAQAAAVQLHDAGAYQAAIIADPHTIERQERP